MAVHGLADLIRFIRVDIGDDGSTQTFTDVQITTMIAKAASRLDARIGACQNPATSGGFISFDQETSGGSFIASGTFVLPSGASTSGLPSPLFNLLMLQVECMMAKRIHFDSVGKAIRVRDGDTEIDTSVGAAGLLALTTSQGGPCAEFEKALEAYCDVEADDVHEYAQIIWKGNIRKTQTHSTTGVEGDIKVEKMPDFSDFLDGGHFDDDPHNVQDIK